MTYPEEHGTPHRIVTTPLDHIDNDAYEHLCVMWEAFKEMEKTDKRLLCEESDWVTSRLGEMSNLMETILDFCSTNRPTIAVLEHHFRALCVRSMLENDAVFSIVIRLIVGIQESSCNYDDCAFQERKYHSQTIPPTMAISH